MANATDVFCRCTEFHRNNCLSDIFQAGLYVGIFIVIAIFLLVICFDVLSLAISTDFLIVSALILVLSFGPVVACFWPERQRARSVD